MVLTEGVPTSVRVSCEVARSLEEAGSSIVFATVLANPDLADGLADLGIPYESLDAVNSRSYPAASLRAARALGRHRVDILHCAEPIAALVGHAASVTRRRGRRLFDRQHSDAAWRQAWLSKVASRTAHIVRVPSQAAAGWAVAEDGIEAGKVRVVPNPASEPRTVDQEELAELRRSLGIPAEAVVLSTVARLREGKGIQIAIEALQSMSECVERPVHYVVAGGGPYEAKLAATAARMPNVHLVGQVDDVAPWHAIGNIGLMPSFNESFGIAAAEVMAAGRPLVASAVGGLLEIVDDEVTGLLVPPKDAIALAAATVRLIADPERARAMGEAAQQRFRQRFTYEAFAEGMLGCYREALAS